MEVAIVTADVACEKRHIRPVENVVRPEYEAAFRQDYQALISAVPPLGK